MFRSPKEKFNILDFPYSSIALATKASLRKWQFQANTDHVFWCLTLFLCLAINLPENLVLSSKHILDPNHFSHLLLRYLDTKSLCSLTVTSTNDLYASTSAILCTQRISYWYCLIYNTNWHTQNLYVTFLKALYSISQSHPSHVLSHLLSPSHVPFHLMRHF